MTHAYMRPWPFSGNIYGCGRIDSFHSLALAWADSATAFSRRNLRRIFPDGFLGIASMNRTPPASRLVLLTRCASQVWISSAVALLPAPRTIYARGASVPSLIRCQCEVVSWLAEECQHTEARQ
jgi:hypothetical protein